MSQHLSPRFNVGFVVLSFLIQNHSFNIEVGEGKSYFLKESEKKTFLEKSQLFLSGIVGCFSLD